MTWGITPLRNYLNQKMLTVGDFNRAEDIKRQAPH